MHVHTNHTSWRNTSSVSSSTNSSSAFVARRSFFVKDHASILNSAPLRAAYNQPFTLDELHQALHSCRNSSDLLCDVSLYVCSRPLSFSCFLQSYLVLGAFPIFLERECGDSVFEAR